VGKNKAIGVVIGRFHLPKLHPGHCELITHVQSLHQTVLVVCGYDPKWPRVEDISRQPYPLAIQKQIVQSQFPEVIVGEIRDSGGRPELWSKWLDEIILAVAPQVGAVLYGSRDSFIPLYSGQFATVQVEQHFAHSATEVRQEVGSQIIDDPIFRQGWLAALAHVCSCTQ
jgi:bifunctional NMN adenylyltransferase/nudix hydrolase